MPLWRIFSHPGVFSPAQRQSISEAVTGLYTAQGVELPAFYVIVIFIDTPDGSVYVGGKENKNFVRIAIENIARKMDDKTEAGLAYRKRWMDKIGEKVTGPFIASRSLDFEVHANETPRDLWRIQGLIPPPSLSEEEKKWVEANKPLPYY